METTQTASNITKPYAIIIGLDGTQGLQTARILADHQVPVIAFAKDMDHYCCRTNVCEQIMPTEAADERLVRKLEDLGAQLEEKAVLIPCSDMYVLLLSRHREQLEKWYHVLLPPADVVEMLLDKISFYTYAQKEGLPIPKTFILHNRVDAEQAAEELTFPAIVKPPISATPAWEKNSKLKAYKVTTRQELLDLYDQCRSWSDILIAQDWVEGDDTNLCICNCYFNANSEPLVTFVSRKLRQWPPRTGECCLGVEYDNETVLAESLRLFKAVGYYGLGYLEMKRDTRSGKYYIMEPNVGRPTGQGAIAEGGGVELIYTMYCDTVGLPLPTNRQQTYGGVKWIFLRRDLQSALFYWRRKELTLKEWWQSMRGRKRYAIFSWRDPGPFVGDLQRSIRLFMKSEERQKRDYANPSPQRQADQVP